MPIDLFEQSGISPMPEEQKRVEVTASTPEEAAALEKRMGALASTGMRSSSILKKVGGSEEPRDLFAEAGIKVETPEIKSHKAVSRSSSPQAWLEAQKQFMEGTVKPYVGETARNVPKNIVEILQGLKGLGGALKPTAQAPYPGGPLIQGTARTIVGGAENIGRFAGLPMKEPRPEETAFVKGVKEPLAETIKHPLEYVKEKPVEAALNIIPAASYFKGATGAQAVSQSRNIDFAIKKGWLEGLHAGMERPKKIKDINRYLDRAKEVTVDITRNKDNISFLSKKGEQITGRTPETISEMAQAFDSRKMQIGQAIADKNAAMGAKGVMVDPTNLVKDLRDYAKSLVAEESGSAKYAMEKADFFESKGKMSIADLQAEITRYNKRMKATPSYAETGTIEDIDSRMLSHFRRMHDDAILKNLGESDKNIRKLYSDYLATEGDVTAKLKAELIRGGANPNEVSKLFSKYTLGELAFGISTGHWLAVGKAGGFAFANKVIDFFTSPSRKIAKMFEDVDRVLTPKGPSIVGKALKATGPAETVKRAIPTDEELATKIKEWVEEEQKKKKEE